MSHTHYVYTVTRRATGQAYVGVTDTPARRWEHHKRYAKRGIGAALREFGF